VSKCNVGLGFYIPLHPYPIILNILVCFKHDANQKLNQSLTFPLAITALVCLTAWYLQIPKAKLCNVCPYE